MTTVADPTALPVVDLRADAGDLCERLRTAAHDVGFFYLVGHDVPAELTRELLEMALAVAEPYADELGCHQELDGVVDLMERRGGAGRQRAYHEIAGMDFLLRELARLTCPTGR